MIGDSAILVGTDSDITIKGQEFRGTKGLWEVVTRKNVNRKPITTDGLKKYKKILVLTNAHLTDYQNGGDIQVKRGPNFMTSYHITFRRPGGGVSNPHYDVGG